MKKNLMVFSGILLTSCFEDKVFEDKETIVTNLLSVDDNRYSLMPDKKSGKHMSKKYKHKNNNFHN